MAQRRAALGAKSTFSVNLSFSTAQEVVRVSVFTSLLPVGELRQRGKGTTCSSYQVLLCGWQIFHPSQSLSALARLRKVKERIILDSSRFSFQNTLSYLQVLPTGNSVGVERSYWSSRSGWSKRVRVCTCSGPGEAGGPGIGSAPTSTNLQPSWLHCVQRRKSSLRKSELVAAVSALCSVTW